VFVSFEIDSVVFECLSVCSCVFLSESEIKSDRMRDCGCYVVDRDEEIVFEREIMFAFSIKRKECE